MLRVFALPHSEVEDNLRSQKVSSGASEHPTPEAKRLFETAELFLLDFEERAIVDVGLASAPWSMGRSQLLLMNGSPSGISIFDIIPDG